MQYGRPILVDGEGDVSLVNVEIKKFQKQAIDLNTTGDITIRSVTITGAGEQAIIAQNGIILRKGNAVIDDVTISGLFTTRTTSGRIAARASTFPPMRPLRSPTPRLRTWITITACGTKR